MRFGVASGASVEATTASCSHSRRPIFQRRSFNRPVFFNVFNLDCVAYLNLELLDAVNADGTRT